MPRRGVSRPRWQRSAPQRAGVRRFAAGVVLPILSGSGPLGVSSPQVLLQRVQQGADVLTRFIIGRTVALKARSVGLHPQRDLVGSGSPRHLSQDLGLVGGDYTATALPEELDCALPQRSVFKQVVYIQRPYEPAPDRRHARRINHSASVVPHPEKCKGRTQRTPAIARVLPLDRYRGTGLAYCCLLRSLVREPLAGCVGDLDQRQHYRDLYQDTDNRGQRRT